MVDKLDKHRLDTHLEVYVMKRKDEWSYEEDLLLAQTVLTHIENKSTQLNAFEEVGERLKRTAAACGFRWNSKVRKEHSEAIKRAKKTKMISRVNRIKKTAMQVFDTPTTNKIATDESSLELVIKSLNVFHDEYHDLKKKNTALQQKVMELNNQLDEVKNLSTPADDMQNLMQIIRRAEQLGLFEKLNVGSKEKPAG